MRYTDGSYLALNEDWHSEDSPWKAGQIMQMVKRQSLTPGVVIEVGCGAGRILYELQRRLSCPTEYWGFDISPDAIRLAKPYENAGLHYEVGDYLEERGEYPRPDLILCVDVIEHVEDMFGFLRKLTEIGSPIIFHIPLDMAALVVARNRVVHAQNSVGHIHYFDKDTALGTLALAGYTVKDWFYTPVGIDRPTESGRVLVPLRRLAYRVNSDLAARLLGGFSLLVLAEPRS